MGGLTRTERLVIASIVAATALAGIAHYADWAPLLAFTVATVALAGLAHVVSLATEQVGERFGAAATGLLQSTLGNLPELFVVIFALRAGEVVVAQTSIVGSILANALLVLGLVIVFGARAAPDGTMRFARGCPTTPRRCCWSRASSSCSSGSPTRRTSRRRATSVRCRPSRRSACSASTWRGWCPTCAARRRASRGAVAPRVALRVAIGLLAAGGVASAFVSDWFVAALRPTIDQLGVSEAFAGLVVVALAGNAVENVAGVVLAHKGQADLAISVVKNSVAQVAAFLYPVLVLISLLFAHQLTFALAPVLIGAAAAHRAVGVADHRRRRGGGLRGLGARGAVRDPRRLHALRVMGRRARIVAARGGGRRGRARGDRRLRRPGAHRRRRAATAAPGGRARAGRRGGRGRRPLAPGRAAPAASSAIASASATSGSACARPSGARPR